MSAWICRTHEVAVTTGQGCPVCQEEVRCQPGLLLAVDVVEAQPFAKLSGVALWLDRDALLTALKAKLGEGK